MVKSTAYISRGSRFNFQLHMIAHRHLELLPWGSNALYWPSWALHSYNVQTYRQITHIYKIKRLQKKERKEGGREEERKGGRNSNDLEK